METPQNIKTEKSKPFFSELLNNKKILWAAVIIVALLTVTFVFNDSARETFLEKRGSMIVNEINDYKVNNGAYPDSLSYMGYKMDESGPFFYQKLDTANFILWFETNEGKIRSYLSNKKSWE